ncbi:MAG: hypothetical protein IKA48_00215 [Fibrobacter sp.]|nr:hypothetical protein [Fibrobacter sp.]
MPDITVANDTQLAGFKVEYKVDDGCVETRGAYLEIARGDDGKSIIGAYVAFQDKCSVLFKTPALHYVGTTVKHYSDVKKTGQHACICKDERMLLVSLYKWLNKNKISVSLGRNINDDVELIKERMLYHKIEDVSVPAYNKKCRIYTNGHGRTILDFAGFNIVDGGTFTL